MQIIVFNRIYSYTSDPMKEKKNNNLLNGILRLMIEIDRFGHDEFTQNKGQPRELPNIVQHNIFTITFFIASNGVRRQWPDSVTFSSLFLFVERIFGNFLSSVDDEN